MKMHLVIPMSGQGKRFQKAGHPMPKPLVPVNGKPLITRLLESFPTEWPTIFVLSEAHRNTELPPTLKKLRPEATQLFVELHDKGPGYALMKTKGVLPPDAPTLVSYCDYGMVWDANHFDQFVRRSECDACLVSYKGFHAHYLGPNPYAYSRMKGDNVLQVKEKGSFTDQRENEYASNGAYFFGRAEFMYQALEAQEKLDLRLGGETYTSLTMEALLQVKKPCDMRVYEIPFFYQWGTPEDVRIYEYWEKTFDAYIKWKGKDKGPTWQVSQILLPMAGGGTRFKGLFTAPKPFLQIENEALYEKAYRCLPTATKKRSVLTLKEYEKHFGEKEAVEERLFLPETPPGQALTTEVGAKALDKNEDVIVTACDHEIVIDPNDWKAFKAKTDIDAAIFTIKGFPGVLRKPTAFAYVVPANEQERFPPVAKVFVKEPPPGVELLQANLLVGSFWFRNSEILLKGIAELKAKNIRVNNELYLDSVFALLKDAGLKVCQFPLKGYVGYGTPDDLAESLYWMDVFQGKSLTQRPRFPGVKG